MGAEHEIRDALTNLIFNVQCLDGDAGREARCRCMDPEA